MPGYAARSLKGRYTDFLRRLPRGVRARIRDSYARLVPLLTAAGNPEKHSARLPYWMMIPAELSAMSATRVDGADARNDLLWAQFCLFLFIRLQDDVLDEEATDASLLFAADLFLLESERVFRLRLGFSPRFHPFLLDCVETTGKAILATRALHRKPASIKKLLDLPSSVNAIFKPAQFASCLLLGKERAFPRLEQAYDALAVAGQLLDDFRDLEEDFRNGRVNLVAQLYLARGKALNGTPEERMRLTQRGMRGDSGARCFGKVLEKLEDAEKALGKMRSPAIDRYLSLYRRHVAAETMAVGRKGGVTGFRDWC